MSAGLLVPIFFKKKGAKNMFLLVPMTMGSQPSYHSLGNLSVSIFN